MRNQFLTIILTAAALTSAAQNLSEEVIIDRDITPVIRSVQRPTALTPQLLTPRIDFKPLSFREYVGAAEITRSISTLAPVAWADSLMRSPYRGYASVGYFPVFNLGAAAGYRFIHNRTTDIGAKVAYDGCSWNGAKNAESKYRNNRLEFAVDGSHRFGYGTLEAGLAYTYSSSTAARYPLMYERGTQAINIVDFNVAFRPAKTGVFEWNIKADIGYGGFTKDKSAALAPFNRFSLKPVDYVPTKDASFGLGSDLSLNMRGGSAIVLGIGLKFRHLNTYTRLVPVTALAAPLDADTAVIAGESLGAHTQGIITLRPGYTFRGKAFTGRLGIRVDVNTGGIRGGTRIAPDIEINWHPSDFFAATLNATGGESMNTNADLWNRNPWMTGTLAMERSHVNADIQLSATFGSYKGFWATVQGGWSSVSNWMTPVEVDGINVWLPASSFNGFNVGLELGYAFSDKFIVTGHARAASHAKYYRWQDNAKYVLDLTAKIRPIDKLQIDLGFDARFDRRGYSVSAAPATANTAKFVRTPVNLGNASNLYAGIEYRLFNPLTIFLKGENLLARHWNITNNIRSQGIHGLLGLQLLF